MVARRELGTEEGRGSRPEDEEKAQNGNEEEESFSEANHVGARMARDLVWGEDHAKSMRLKGTNRAVRFRGDQELACIVRDLKWQAVQCGRERGRSKRGRQIRA